MIENELRENLSGEGAGRFLYTRRAFGMLPALDGPRILDVGCGAGGPTLELARLSGGQVIGLDVDRPSVATCARKIAQAGLSHRVQVVSGSMFAMGFRDGSFDVVWSEGAIFVMGFQRGLKAWHRLIKPGGFLIVHEQVLLRPDPPPEVYSYWKGHYPGIGTVAETADRIPACGYEPVGHFALPEDAWWTEYYGPLQARVHELRARYAGDRQALAALDREQREIDLYKKHQRWYGSAFFVMRKRTV